jgi:hypothetical protein
MSRTTSSALRRMANAQETGEALLALVEITHSSMTGSPIRVAQNLQAMVCQGNTYIAFPFQIKLPDDSDEVFPEVTLAIDAVDQTIATAIRSLSPSQSPSVTIKIVLASQPDTVEMAMNNMILRSVQGDAFTIEGKLTLDDSDLETFPEGSFSQKDFPGMFQ